MRMTDRIRQLGVQHFAIGESREIPVTTQDNTAQYLAGWDADSIDALKQVIAHSIRALRRARDECASPRVAATTNDTGEHTASSKRAANAAIGHREG